MGKHVQGPETVADLGQFPLGNYCTTPGCGHRQLIKVDALTRYEGRALLLLPFRCIRCGTRGSQALLIFDERSEVEEFVYAVVVERA